MKHQIRSQFDSKAKLAFWGAESSLKCAKLPRRPSSSPHLCLIGLKFANFTCQVVELASCQVCKLRKIENRPFNTSYINFNQKPKHLFTNILTLHILSIATMRIMNDVYLLLLSVCDQ